MPISSHCPDLSEAVTRTWPAFGWTLTLLAGCAATAPPGPAPAPGAGCTDAPSAYRQITLYFGRGRRGGEVSDSEWTGFVAQVLAPRFAKGFTVWDAAGQWQDSTGAIVQERSKIVRLIADDPAGARSAVAAIVNEYRRRFAQEAVLQTEADVCVRWTGRGIERRQELTFTNDLGGPLGALGPAGRASG